MLAAFSSVCEFMSVTLSGSYCLNQKLDLKRKWEAIQ